MTIHPITSSLDAIIWDMPAGKPDVKYPLSSCSEALERPRVFQQGQKGSTCLYYALLPLRRRFGPLPIEGHEVDRVIERIASLWRKQITSISPLYVALHDKGPDVESFHNIISRINLGCLSTLGEDPVLMVVSFLGYTRLFNEGTEVMRKGLYKIALQYFEGLGPLGKSKILFSCVIHTIVQRFKLPISSWNPASSKEKLICELKVKGPMAVLGMLGVVYFKTKSPQYARHTTIEHYVLLKDFYPQAHQFHHAVVVIGCEETHLGTIVYFKENEASSLEQRSQVYAVEYDTFTKVVAPFSIPLGSYDGSTLKDEPVYYGVHAHPSLLAGAAPSKCHARLYNGFDKAKASCVYNDLLTPLIQQENRALELKKSVEEIEEGLFIPSHVPDRYKRAILEAMRILTGATGEPYPLATFDELSIDGFLRKEEQIIFPYGVSLLRQLLERETHKVDLLRSKTAVFLLECFEKEAKSHSFSKEFLMKALAELPSGIYNEIKALAAKYIGPSEAKKAYENTPFFGEQRVKEDIMVLASLIRNSSKIRSIFPEQSLFNLQDSSKSFCNISLLISLLSNPSMNKNPIQEVFDRLSTDIQNKIFGLVYFERVASDTYTLAAERLKLDPSFLFKKDSKGESLFDQVREKYRFSEQKKLKKWNELISSFKDKIQSHATLTSSQKKSIILQIDQSSELK